MRTRADFNRYLEEHTVPGRVYFQAPESTTLKTPYVVYDISSIDGQFADDLRYRVNAKYSVQLVTKNADDPVLYELLKLRFTTLDNHFVVDRLHHYQFTMYF